MPRFTLAAFILILLGTGVAAAQSSNRAPVAAAGNQATNSGLRATSATAATIGGLVLNGAGEPIPGAPVRLRDARFGRILRTEATGTAGEFEFASIDPGSYVVELLGDDRMVLAASRLLHVVAGETTAETLQLPADRRWSRVLIGALPRAGVVLGAAAAAGVLATGVPGDSVSPR